MPDALIASPPSNITGTDALFVLALFGGLALLIAAIALLLWIVDHRG